MMSGQVLKIAAVCGMTSLYAHAETKPNIIIILADDLGYGDISYYNKQSRIETPGIDRMAQCGLNFTDAHAAGAVSIPSRYGLLTGRYQFRAPKQFSYHGYSAPLIEKGRKTIGTVLQESGYTTACIGKWHLGLNWQLKPGADNVVGSTNSPGYTNVDFSKEITHGPNQLGFDYSFIIPASLDMPPYVFLRNGKVVDPSIVLSSDLYSNPENVVYAWDRKHTRGKDIYWEQGVWWREGEMSKSFRTENCLQTIVDEGIGFIRRQVAEDKGKPFLLYLPLTAPHTPCLPEKRFRDRSQVAAYGGFVMQVDDVVSQINTLVEQLGIAEQTIVIFTSDNGSLWEEEDTQRFGHRSNGDRRGQKGDAWDGGHRIPLIIKAPFVKQEVNYRHPVSLIDFFATFAEMNNIPLNPQDAEDSFSWMSILKGNFDQPVRDHVIYLSSNEQLAILKDNWKYINCLGSGGFTAPSRIKPTPNGPQGQLYHVLIDPLETTDLYFSEPEKVKDLKSLLDEYVKKGFSRK